MKILKKLCLIMLVFSLVASVLPFGVMAATLEEKIFAEDDTQLSSSKKTTTYGDTVTLSVSSDSSTRYILLRFSVTEEQMQANTIELKLMINKQAGDLTAYGLEGDHKNWTEEELTWNKAAAIKVSETSLNDYTGNALGEFLKADNEDGKSYMTVDVTDYVKAQEDGIAAFKVAASDSGSKQTQIRAKEYENTQANTQPYLSVKKTVADDEFVEKDLAVITLSDEPYEGDFILPSTGTYSSELTWESLDTELIEIVKENGLQKAVIHRPSFEDGDKDVTLRVTAEYASASDYKDITVTVKCRPDDMVAIRADLDAITLSDEPYENDFELPSVGSMGTTLKWQSLGVRITIENKDGIQKAILDRPFKQDGDKEVTLRVTAESGGKSDFKDITVTVKAFPNGETFTMTTKCVEDTYIYKPKPDINYGAETKVYIDGRPANYRVALMRFELNDYILNNSTKVMLRYRPNNIADQSQGDPVISVYAISEELERSWEENSLTWNNAGELANYSDNYLGQFTFASEDIKSEMDAIDITDFVKSQQDSNIEFYMCGKEGTIGSIQTKESGYPAWLEATVFFAPEESVKLDHEALNIGTKDETTGKINVTGNVLLRLSGKYKSKITWVSSNTDVVKIDGEVARVTRPEFNETDAEVKLTATIEKDGYSETEEFILVVKRKPTPQEKLDAIAASLTEGELLSKNKDKNSVTTDLNLPLMFEGAEIVWESDSEVIVVNDGVGSVYPEIITDAENRAVTLTATIKSEGLTVTKEFVFIVQSANYFDMAKDAAITASSAQSNKPSVILDGKTNTAWSAADNDTQPFVTLQFDKMQKINSIKLYFNEAGTGYSLSYSNDGKTYISAKASGTSTGNAWETCSIDAVEARYLRCTFIKGDAAVQLSEMQVFYKVTDELILKEALNSIYFENYILTEDITLPQITDNGVSLVWTSSDGAIEVEGGKGIVTRGSDDISVTLTAAASRNSLTDTREFEFLVKKKSTDGGGNGGGGSSGGGGGAYLGPQRNENSSVVITQSAETAAKDRFTDVPKTHWAYEYIENLFEQGVVNGVSADLFAPDNKIKREEALKMLVNAFGIKGERVLQFADVDKNAWYASYVDAAASVGIVNGIGDNMFGVGTFITRQDLAVMAYRTFVYAGGKLNGTESIDFRDDADIAEYAKESVKILTAAGILSGDEDSYFAPAEYATRAQMTKIISLLLENVK